jgi:methylenetetrahydrofolate reductase (NADPH)
MFASRHASNSLRPQLALHALQVSASNTTSAAVALPPASFRRRHSRSHFASSTSLRSFSTTDTATPVQSCLANYSIEVTPGAAKKVSSFAEVEGLAPNTSANVTYLVGADINEPLDICARLVEGGMLPVAHVPARAFPTLSDVEDYLSELNQLGCREVLVLGGGAAEPAGELHETMQILDSGLLQKYEFHKVGVAAHPEGHPDIPDDELRSALLRKALWARDQNVELYYETQFCFEPEPIIAWEMDMHTRSMLQEHIEDPASMPTVRLGIAGPAKIANLIKFGVMSGVGNSLRFFTKYTGNIFKLATTATPIELIIGVAQHQEEQKDCMMQQLYVYPLGGLKSTLKWVNEQLDVGEGK